MWAFFQRFCSPKVVWSQPRWSYVPEMWRSFSKLLHPWFMLRTILLAGLIFGILVAGLKAALPQLQLVFLWKAPIAVLGLWAYFALMGPLYCAIPPRVELRAKLISIQHGNHVRLILMSSVVSTHLTIFAADRI